MNRLFTALFFVGLIVAAMAAEQEYCDTSEGKVEVGKEYFTENPCMRNKCVAKGQISGVGCAAFPMQPGCKTVTGTGKWPACCPKPVCSYDES